MDKNDPIIMECVSLNEEQKNNYYLEKLLKNNEFQKIYNSMHKDQWIWEKPKEQKCPHLGYLKSLFSSDIKISENERKVCFHSTNSYSTIAVSANRSLKSNTIAYWEIEAKLLYGTSMMFGIGTEKARQNAPIEFLDLLGEDNQSYGLSYEGNIQFNGKKQKFCKKLQNESLNKPVIIGILFNGPKKCLSYYVNGEKLGTAFNNMELNNKIFHPMISSTAQRSVFTLQNERILEIPASLFSLSMQTIIQKLNISEEEFAKNYQQLNSKEINRFF